MSLILFIGVATLIATAIQLKAMGIFGRSNYTPAVVPVAAPPPPPTTSKLNGNKGFNVALQEVPVSQATITSPAAAAGAAPIVVQGPNARNIQLAKAA
jgi:hypothetical protein